MPGFLSPFWLLLLAGLPLIRWLHRWRAPLSEWQVSAVFLWASASQDAAPGDTRNRPDPAWRRRALAAALLVIALSRPYWELQAQSVIVWVDDSPSMFTLEDGKTRLANAFELLLEQLAASDNDVARNADIRLRSLTNPAHTVIYSRGIALDANDWRPAHVRHTFAPPLPDLYQLRSHWLVTDGASEGVRAWAQRVQPERIIQTGWSTENSALTVLAASRDPVEDTHFDILVTVANTGLQPVTRLLRLESGGQLLMNEDLQLEPGETIHLQRNVATTANFLSATLTPTDALDLDDHLTLSMDPLQKVPVRVDRNCGLALRRVLNVHPAVRLSDTNTAQTLVISCPQTAFDTGPDTITTTAGARIRVLNGPSQKISTTPVWLPNERTPDQLVLSSGWLSVSRWPASYPQNGRRRILDAGGYPLAFLHNRNAAGFASVDTVIDLAYLPFTQQPEYAAFVATLMDLATGRQLLDEAASVSGDKAASTVIPGRIETEQNRSRQYHRRSTQSVSSWFVMLAALLLALDVALLIRARQGSRRG